MNILLLDTSTHVFSIALATDGTVIAEFSGDAGPASSAKIPGHIDALLSAAQLDIAAIDAFAVTIGPGAFTGVRVGIALIKGLAYATAQPVIPLSSLELLALNASASTIPVCALFDARKGEVYSALYRFDDGMVQVRPEMALDPAALLEQLSGDILFIGDGALRYRELISEGLGPRAHFAPEQLNMPQASAGAALAQRRCKAGQTVTPAELAPHYLRLPEAEINKR